MKHVFALTSAVRTSLSSSHSSSRSPALAIRPWLSPMSQSSMSATTRPANSTRTSTPPSPAVEGKTGEIVTSTHSNGGSGAQARAVIDGLNADVVTLALASDIDAIAQKTGKLCRPIGSRACPNDALHLDHRLPGAQGQSVEIKDWADLTKPGVQVITPNPKTSSGARWNFLAAYAYALKQSNGDDAKAKAFVGALYRNVPVLDRARAARRRPSCSVARATS